MSEPRTCPVTGHPIGRDRFAAPAAAGRLRASLAGLPELMDELEATIVRMVRMGVQTGAGGDERLDYNPEASERAWVLRQTLLVWVEELAHRRGQQVPDTWRRVGEVLTAWADWMTTSEAGAQAIDEILDAHFHALRAIDRPADRTYAGPCPTCHGDVYGRPGVPEVRCTTCGDEFDLDDAREVMLDQLAVMHLPASDAARAVSLLTGRAVTAAMVRRWKHRGLIAASGVNASGQPLYDLTELVGVAQPERIGA